ncbi:MAG: hypothetical protein JWQ49_822 [Edaphobacter sp.]|nr:hypothetical protein [Edaphobacter sp.]
MPPLPDSQEAMLRSQLPKLSIRFPLRSSVFYAVSWITVVFTSHVCITQRSAGDAGPEFKLSSLPEDQQETLNKAPAKGTKKPVPRGSARSVASCYFLWQIPPIGPVLPIVPTHKGIAVIVYACIGTFTRSKS